MNRVQRYHRRMDAAWIVAVVVACLACAAFDVAVIGAMLQ
jgi:hypothetical protein